MAKKTRFDRFLQVTNSMSFPKKKIRFEEAADVMRGIQRDLKKKSDKRIAQDIIMALMLGR